MQTVIEVQKVLTIKCIKDVGYIQQGDIITSIIFSFRTGDNGGGESDIRGGANHETLYIYNTQTGKTINNAYLQQVINDWIKLTYSMVDPHFQLLEKESNTYEKSKNKIAIPNIVIKR